MAVGNWVQRGGLYFGSIQLTSATYQGFMDEVCSQLVPDRSIAVIPQGFKASAVFFDMDATIIVEESLVEISKNFGVYKQVEEITSRAMNGELDFADSLRQRLALIAGAPKKLLDDFIGQYHFNGGVEDAMKFFQRTGVPVFMVSGGFTYIAKAIQKRLGLNDVHANEIEIVDQVITGETIGEVVDANAKSQWMLSSVCKLGGDQSKVVAVGDGANDKEMLTFAGLAVGFRPKAVLYPLLDVHIGLDQDHRFLLAALAAEKP